MGMHPVFGSYFTLPTATTLTTDVASPPSAPPAAPATAPQAASPDRIELSGDASRPDDEWRPVTLASMLRTVREDPGPLLIANRAAGTVLETSGKGWKSIGEGIREVDKYCDQQMRDPSRYTGTRCLMAVGSAAAGFAGGLAGSIGGLLEGTGKLQQGDEGTWKAARRGVEQVPDALRSVGEAGAHLLGRVGESEGKAMHWLGQKTGIEALQQFGADVADTGVGLQQETKDNGIVRGIGDLVDEKKKEYAAPGGGIVAFRDWTRLALELESPRAFDRLNDMDKSLRKTIDTHQKLRAAGYPCSAGVSAARAEKMAMGAAADGAAGVRAEQAAAKGAAGAKEPLLLEAASPFDVRIGGTTPTTISPEMEKKILGGMESAKGNHSGKQIGGHSHSSLQREDVEVVLLEKYDNEVRKALYRRRVPSKKNKTQFSPYKGLSKGEPHLLFPDHWKEAKILEATREVGREPVYKIQFEGKTPTATFHRKTVDGVDIQVIKTMAGEVTASYPVMQAATPWGSHPMAIPTAVFSRAGSQQGRDDGGR